MKAIFYVICLFLMTNIAFAQNSDSTARAKKESEREFKDFDDTPPATYIYAGTGIGNYARIKDYDSRSFPFFVGFESSGASIKGFKLPNIFSTGAYFGYNSYQYDYVNTYYGDYKLKYTNFTLSTRFCLRLMPIINGIAQRKVTKLPFDAYIGLNAGYEYVIASVEGYEGYGAYSAAVGSRAFVQPVAGAEIYPLGPLGVFVELGATGKGFLAAGIRLRFMKK